MTFSSCVALNRHLQDNKQLHCNKKTWLLRLSRESELYRCEHPSAVRVPGSINLSIFLSLSLSSPTSATLGFDNPSRLARLPYSSTPLDMSYQQRQTVLTSHFYRDLPYSSSIYSSSAPSFPCVQTALLAVSQVCSAEVSSRAVDLYTNT